MSHNLPGILSCGAALPANIRTNDDPCFHSITRTLNSQGVAESDIFTGLNTRHVFSKHDALDLLTAQACQMALDKAATARGDIDRLYGYLSVSEYLTPNALFRVHHALSLRDDCMVLPVNSEFTNFLIGLIQAWESILAGHTRFSLVACGTNWTQHMDYTQGHAITIGDGAGAAVVGRGGKYAFIDYAIETLSGQYGVMNMQYRHEQQHSTYHIEPEGGIASYINDGMEGPPRLIKRLLSKHALGGQNIALTTHQASRLLLNHWHERIQPAFMFDTLASNGNMTLATLPVNLSTYWDEIETDYLVMLGLGVGFHQIALLLKKIE